MPFATLRALHAIIGDALTEMERVYKESSDGPTPLDYPSLDVPHYYNAAHHTPEEQEAEKLAMNPEVVVAANQIVAACGQLAASVHRPFLSLMEGTMSGHLASCLHFLQSSNTIEILRAAGPNGLHVEEIARQIDELAAAAASAHVAPLDPRKLGHILRLLGTFHWIREVRPNVFANNRLSSIIDTGKTPDQLRNAPQSKHNGSDGVAAALALTSDEFLKSLGYLTDTLLPSNARSTSLRTLLDKSGQTVTGVQYKTPFNLALRTELNYFEWLELPENKARLEEFGRGMKGTRLWEVNENVIGAFAWKEFPKDALVVDIGGGVGSTTMILARSFPHLRFVVEDRPQVVENAPSNWGAPHSEHIKSGQVVFRAQDFFSPRPSELEIPGLGSVTPSVFLIRGCTHNWPDHAVRKWFHHLRDAAGPNTRLFIVDVVLPYVCYDDTDYGKEPISGADRTLAPEGSPLLANLGKASASGYLLDLSMTAQFDAKERTLEEMASLALETGWKISSMTRGKGSLWAYITAEPI